MNAVYRDQLVVTTHRDTNLGSSEIVLTGMNAGPAGEIIVRLAPGLDVAVDFAQPGVLTSIVIDEMRVGQLRFIMSELIGSERWLKVQEVVDSPRPVRLERDVIDPGSSLNPRRTNEAFASTMQALGHLTDPDQPALIRLLAAGEALRGLERIQLGGVFDAVMELVIRECRNISEIRDESDDWMADLTDLASRDVKLATMSGDLLSSVDRLVRLPMDEINQVIRQGWNARLSRRVQSSESSSSDVSDFSVEVGPRGRLWIHGPGQPAGRWVRVLDRRDLSVVATVPIVLFDGGFESKAVIPTRFGESDIEIDITDAPFPAGSPSSTRRVIAAIRLGRQAATQSAEGRGDGAWLDCAAAWEAVGDQRRAKLAMSFLTPSRRSSFVSRRAPVSDRVRDALHLQL